MADLLNYQWELGGVVFGLDCPIDHESDSEPMSFSWRSQDQPNPSADGTTQGVDLIEPGTWNFKLFTNCSGEGEALDALEELALVWRADDVRFTPGKAMALRYRLNNRTRVVYGRPGRWTAPLGPTFHGGKIDITSDFRCVSELFFDELEESIEVGYDEPVTGGFVTPIITPLSTELASATVPYQFTVAGKLRTPAWVDFVGPIDDGGLLIDGAPFISLAKPVPAGVTLTVDARPWVNSVYRSDGSGVAGALSPRTRLPAVWLSKGTHSATLLGSSSTGNGKAVIHWRGANPTV